MGEGGYRQINKTLNACAFEDYLSTQQKRLPKLADVEQVSPRVIRVLGQNAGKVKDSPHHSEIEACLRSDEPQRLMVPPVHTPGNKYLHRGYGIIEIDHRYRPRHPAMGRSTLFHPHHLIHRPVPRIPNPLARRSHWWGSRSSSPLSLSLNLNLQEHAW